MLEKSQNKQQKTFIFNDLSELKHYQSLYGGKLNIISISEQNIEAYVSDLDTGIIDDDDGNSPISYTVKESTKDDIEH